ncbi:unnamed protein product, partial [Ectocarpus sp. 8 AP-2014]
PQTFPLPRCLLCISPCVGTTVRVISWANPSPVLCPLESKLGNSDNFRLVVLDEDDGGVDADAESKAHAAESAKNFLRDRMGSRKRVSHSLFKARKRLGPSPNF